MGDRRGEAVTLTGIGAVYSSLGEKQKALEYFQQALPIERAVADRGGEATTLNNIGRVYDDLGEKQRALEYYQQALPIRRAVGDRGGEATTLNNIGAVYDDLGEKQKALEYQQDRDSHGPLPGRILLDDAFTEQALEQQLRQAYPLVHIASHFVMGLGTDESYLLLGGREKGGQGYRLRLCDLETLQNLSFDGTALLALSACETAMSKQEADGKEVDSLAAIGRQRGAQAVLASLWDVYDASTGRLMADFYRRWTGTRSLPKAEALRQAQLALLQGTDSGAGDAAKAGGGIHRATLSGDARTPDAPAYAHHYWAPFVLMGNWQ